MSTMTQWDGAPRVAPSLRDALRALTIGADDEGQMWRLGDADIAGALSVVGQVRQLVERAEVALVREGVERGLPGESSWSAHDWVSRVEGERSPVPPVRHVAQVVRVAGAGAGVAEVRDSFVEGSLPLGKADQLVRFHHQVAPVADPEMLAADLQVLLEGARDDVEAPRAHRRRPGMSERELTTAISRTGRLLKPERDQDSEDRKAKAARSLTKGAGPCGMSAYRVVLDAEGAAVLDSALAALAGPVKGPEGEPDPRPASQRRADALVEIVRRGVSSPGEQPKTDKAQVVVTIGLEALLAGVQGAGLTSTDEVLPPSVVRRMACDGGIIPAVLGGQGEVLDLGRTVRWFTPGQKKAIWLRDKGCTFPGCTMPPQWCDAHHVDWWSRGGGSDVANGALLCQRHHTRVHSDDLAATITATGVTWHL